MSGCPHFDLTKPETYAGGLPRDVFRHLRQEQPVYWHEDPEQGVGFWAVTRQADLDYVSKHPELFSSAERGCLLNEMEGDQLAMIQTQLINMDPPQHLKYRRLVRAAFTPRMVDTYEERFREVARGLVEKVAPAGRCEFVQDIAVDLPLIAICELMGVPLDKRQRLFELTNIMLGMDDPELSTSEEDGLNAAMEMFMMAMELAAEHRANPRNDIVNVLLTGTVEDEPLSDDDFCNFFLMLIVAGNETTRTVTSHGMRLLMAHPDQYEALVKHPQMIEDAVEEILRYNPAVIAFRRTAMADLELGGQRISKGDKVLMFYGAASADEAVFKDGDRFDITRAQREDVRNEHRAFGVGQHFCLGSHLARLELRVIFEEITRLIRNPRLDGEIKWLRSNFISGIKSMPIVFDVATPGERE
ncbi:cytochrome P450 [Pseudohalioglobus sediminis]|uniref:Cytochrome P450 n=1 Tax=Pseudohalioglobus sediminis TaxID=2606449 RepID=A0A5B0X178_9GAMM|nr:cytochrome P450 [Pseudohalioglobus sediminis]KAA1193032.1 cytochrome P450 [Pseudohalioglobus sediminis]